MARRGIRFALRLRKVWLMPSCVSLTILTCAVACPSGPSVSAQVVRHRQDARRDSKSLSQRLSISNVKPVKSEDGLRCHSS